MDFLQRLFSQKLHQELSKPLKQMQMLMSFVQPEAAPSFALLKSVGAFELQMTSRSQVSNVSGSIQPEMFEAARAKITPET